MFKFLFYSKAEMPWLRSSKTMDGGLRITSLCCCAAQEKRKISRSEKVQASCCPTYLVTQSVADVLEVPRLGCPAIVSVLPLSSSFPWRHPY